MAVDNKLEISKLLNNFQINKKLPEFVFNIDLARDSLSGFRKALCRRKKNGFFASSNIVNTYFSKNPIPEMKSLSELDGRKSDVSDNVCDEVKYKVKQIDVTDNVCSGQLILATDLYSNQYIFSDSLGVSPPL